MISGTIIKLSDNLIVKILDRCVFDNKEYYFCMKLDENENELEDYAFFEYKNDNGTETMKLVQNQATIENLLVAFTGKVTYDIENEEE